MILRWQIKEWFSMVDIVSPKKRSQMMSGIRGKNTKPELVIRKALFRCGFRYRIHDTRLPGKPDMVFPKFRAVILVNGCFWHGHNCHLFKWPSSRQSFWKTKITRNREKDTENLKGLRDTGWRVLVVWECAIKGRNRKPFDNLVDAIRTWLTEGNSYSEIRGYEKETA